MDILVDVSSLRQELEQTQSVSIRTSEDECMRSGRASERAAYETSVAPAGPDDVVS